MRCGKRSLRHAFRFFLLTAGTVVVVNFLSLFHTTSQLHHQKQGLESPATERRSTSVTTSEPSSCWRNCTHRDNVIIYTYTKPQGLSDRLWQLEQLLNIAGYLCASVWYPQPHVLLAAKHNSGKRVDENLTWADFATYTWNSDAGTPIPIHELRNPKHPGLVMSDPQYRGHVKMISTHPQITIPNIDKDRFTITHFVKAQALSFRGRRFLWQIEVNWYDSLIDLLPRRVRLKSPHPTMLPNLGSNQSKDCHYHSGRQLPETTAAFVDEIWSGIQQTYGSATVGHLHIRRRDTKHECDTSLERVESYLKCSLPTAKQPIVLLFASDERDTDYRQGLQQRVEASFSHVSLVDSDALVAKHIEEATRTGRLPRRLDNNYYIFRVVHALGEKAEFALQLRRTLSCNDCDPVMLSS
jgi:hypothetical protein